MNYEQKYNDALERAKKMRDSIIVSHNPESARLHVGHIVNIFPELRESEDERMMTWLITQLKTNYGGNYWAVKAIEYLEKQKEKGRSITANLLEDGITGVQRELIEFLANNIDASWFDVIKSADVYAQRIRSMFEKQKKQWSEEDEKIIENIIDHLREYYVEKVGYPYVMEKDSVEMKEISLLRSIQAKHAQEWGEEEMKYINTCLLILNRPFHDMSDEERAAYNWLKSLRPSWKPSEEQMDALCYAIGEGGLYNKEALISLYEQLKAL